MKDMKNKLKHSLLEILGSPEFELGIRNAGRFRFPTNYLFRMHSHQEFEMNYIRSGSCVMEIGGILTSLKEGDCVLVSPGVPHYFMVGIKKGCSIVQLEYRLELPEKISDAFQFLRGQPESLQISGCRAVGGIMEEICRCFREEKPEMYMQPELEFGFAQLFTAMAYVLAADNRNHVDKNFSKQSRLLQHINRNYDSKLNIEELAVQFGLSSRSVRKYFEESLGMSCTEYVTMLRMEKAKEMLWNSDRSITDIAIAMGYSSSQYFSNVFKEYTGMTPGKFRGSWRGVIAEERIYE